jgi:glycosyltransferase involved in cell wall biosynthesis
VLVSERAELLFVSTRFLFPVDSGGKIRTTQILRGLKGGRFRVVLASPANAELAARHAAEIAEICDELVWWPQPQRGSLFQYTRLRYLAGSLPIPVRTDRQTEGIALVDRLLRRAPAVAVFDFAHAAVLAPEHIPCPSVVFTHNVEAEIFKRHLEVAGNLPMRIVWRNQYAKMRRFEREALRRFDVVVAVAERDARAFAQDYGVVNTFVIPTGVDLEYFSYTPPERENEVVFCGSMDWLPNQDGITWYLEEVWQHVAKRAPDARMTVVGRAPPQRLVAEAARRGLNWRFTGFVDDVRPFVRGAAVSVVPLRVGGGTRLKVYEAMAIGTPLASTAVGVEGLPLTPGAHYLLADDAKALGNAVSELLTNPPVRDSISRAAREYVETRFSYRVAAKRFEEACEQAIDMKTHGLSVNTSVSRRPIEARSL